MLAGVIIGSASVMAMNLVKYLATGAKENAGGVHCTVINGSGIVSENVTPRLMSSRRCALDIVQRGECRIELRNPGYELQKCTCEVGLINESKRRCANLRRSSRGVSLIAVVVSGDLSRKLPRKIYNPARRRQGDGPVLADRRKGAIAEGSGVEKGYSVGIVLADDVRIIH